MKYRERAREVEAYRVKVKADMPIPDDIPSWAAHEARSRRRSGYTGEYIWVLRYDDGNVWAMSDDTFHDEFEAIRV